MTCLYRRLCRRASPRRERARRILYDHDQPGASIDAIVVETESAIGEDLNGDGGIDVSDGLSVLDDIFLDGVPPADPGRPSSLAVHARTLRGRPGIGVRGLHRLLSGANTEAVSATKPGAASETKSG